MDIDTERDSQGSCGARQSAGVERSCLGLLLLPLALFAAPLDQQMSAADRKSAGLFKLTEKEKANLERWIGARYQPRPAPLLSRGEVLSATLEENLHSGRYIKLSDGTIWNIRPLDTPITQSWITPVEISVSSSSDATYPYTLTNSLTGSSVLARRVDSVPSTQPAGEKSEHGAPIH